MSQEDVLAELKKRYPMMTNDQLLDIIRAGAPLVISESTEPPEDTSEPTLVAPRAASSEQDEFSVLKALGDGANLDDLLRFMIIDNYVKERFGKDKDKIPPELKELIEKAKSSKGEGDLDRLIERMMKYEVTLSFIERLGGRKESKPEVDVEKAIRDVGREMKEALQAHKLEDEKTRAEEKATSERRRADGLQSQIDAKAKEDEEDRRFEERLKARTKPLEEKYDALIKEIGHKLKDVDPTQRKGLILDLGEMLTEEVGEEIKNHVIEAVRGSFGERETSAVTVDASGKAQMDWYRLGERALKTIEKFVERIPLQAPKKQEVKPMTTPPRLPTTPTTAPTPPEKPPEKPGKPVESASKIIRIEPPPAPQESAPQETVKPPEPAPTTTSAPTTEQPTTEQPTTEQPTTEQPTTEQPTTKSQNTPTPKEEEAKPAEETKSETKPSEPTDTGESRPEPGTTNTDEKA